MQSGIPIVQRTLSFGYRLGKIDGGSAMQNVRLPHI